MAVAHKAAISFGLVHIPVNMYTATKSSDINFNQLHKECKERIQYKKYCPHCDSVVSNDDIVKGYEYEKDRYVVMDDKDFEKIKTEKDKLINIVQFADIDEIDPVYFEKAYYASPDSGGDKAFELLRTAMKKENKVAIARSVIGTKDSLLTIYPTDSGIIIEKMFYEEELKAEPKPYKKLNLNEKEMDMAKLLIDSMTKPFSASDYKDEYQERLKAAIEEKIKGNEIVAPQVKSDNIIDLMDALKASLDQKQNKTTKSAKTKKTKEPVRK